MRIWKGGRLVSRVLLLVLTTQLAAEVPAALYRQAVDRQRAGDLAGAAQLYRECLEQYPANFQARSNLGAALSGLGRYDEAIREYEAALKMAPVGSPAASPAQYRAG